MEVPWSVVPDDRNEKLLESLCFALIPLVEQRLNPS